MVQIEFLIFILWLVQASYQVLVWVYWIQTKEYRSDRFQVMFKSPEGRYELGTGLLFVKYFLLLMTPFVNYSFNIYLLVIFWLVFWGTQKVIKRQSRRPVFTQRATRIIATAFLVATVVFVFFSNSSSYLHYLILESSLFIGLIFGVYWTGIVSRKVLAQELNEATKRLDQIKPLVIGITGSYGKTTTKDFVTQLLARKYKVERTVGSQNTLFGVVRKINTNFSPDTKIFVAEMGAYKLGEIQSMCKLLQPKIGIITGIELQHIELFRSLENIKHAKFELIESLEKNGIAIFNLNNKECVALQNTARLVRPDLRIFGYKTSAKFEKEHNIIYSKVISDTSNVIKFKVGYQQSIHEFKVRLSGTHFIENLTAAILVAREMQVSWEEIGKSITRLALPSKTMSIQKLTTGDILIDDTYNSTPIGFKSALNYLFTFTNKNKYIATTGIIELGNKAYEVHTELGNLMKRKVKRIYLRNGEFANSIKIGLGSDAHRLEVVDDMQRLYIKLKHKLDGNSVLLLEGKLPESFIGKIKSI